MGRFTPSLTCNGICKQYKARKPHPTAGSRYGLGQKRCQSCQEYIWWKGLWCPCCNQRLRTKPRSNFSRKMKPVIRL